MITRLHVTNASSSPVLTYITLGATPGCVQDVADLTISDGLTINKLYPLQGTFVLPPTTIEITAPEGLGFNGNLSFGTPPLNCPCPDWPEGVALAEFIINNGFQPGGQETVDISCVCGSNAYLGFDLSSDDWTANGGAISVKRIRNSTRYENTGLVGVYPYSCTNCTASVGAPKCVGEHPEYANALPICNVQRSASQSGGIVRVIFDGWTPVPL